jgi:mRNA-degrading endonuclease RelE of RelBE toxin-antitoxin system
MAYLVRITTRAQRDFANLYGEINAVESGAALKWYGGLKEAVLRLEEHPERCPITPENKRLRHLLYGNKPHIYRVIYRVLENRKRVDVTQIIGRHRPTLD